MYKVFYRIGDGGQIIAMQFESKEEFSREQVETLFKAAYDSIKAAGSKPPGKYEFHAS